MIHRTKWAPMLAIIAVLALMLANDVGCMMSVTPEQQAAMQTQVDGLQEMVDGQAKVIETERARALALTDEIEKAKAMEVIETAEKVHGQAVAVLEDTRAALDNVEISPDGTIDVVGSVLPFVPPPFGTIGALIWGALATVRAGTNRGKQVSMISAMERAKHADGTFGELFKNPDVRHEVEKMGAGNRGLVDAVTSGRFVSPL